MNEEDYPNDADETIDISLSESDEEVSDDVPEKEDTVINFVSRYPRRNRRPPTHIKSCSPNLTSMKTNDMPSLKEAMASPDRMEWIIAILREIHVLKERETFILVPRPSKCTSTALKICFKN